MQGSRRLWIVIGVIIVALLALVTFYVWLVGGAPGTEEVAESAISEREGLVHVRSIYTYAGTENVVRPVGIGADAEGGFFVTLIDSARIVEFDRSGEYVQHWGERGTDPGNLLSPTGVDVDRLSGHVYVIDRARLRLIAYGDDGTFLWEVPVLNPVSISVDPDGRVVVTTFGPIARFTSEGEYLGQAGSRGQDPGQFDYARQAAPDRGDIAYVADSNNSRIQKVQLAGEPTATVHWVVGEKPVDAEDSTTRFGLPTGITLAQDGRPVVLDSFRHTIEMLDADSGESISDFGGERRGVQDGLLNFPTNIVHISGDTYALTDTGNDRVQLVRLLAPDDRQPWKLWPWLRWLALLPLLLLPLFFGRKRRFVTDETLRMAAEDGNARLLLAATKEPYVLPDTAERYGDVVESDVRVGDHVRVLDSPVGDAATAEERLLQAAQRTLAQRILLRRHIVACIDADQCARAEDAGLRAVPYSELLEEYALED